jgi:hypothetical protein
MVRRFIFSRSDIFKTQWCTTSDLKAPTYEDRSFVNRIVTARQLSP